MRSISTSRLCGAACCCGYAPAIPPGKSAPSRFSENIRRTRRSEEHTSELQSLMRISYAVFCLKKKKKTKQNQDIQSLHVSYTTQRITICHEIHTNTARQVNQSYKI